jgi:glycosyltransferase involved in cell wall biosynthesis
MARLDLTAIVLTYNEELHIARCLASVRDIATDIVVVDSFSTDRTVAIAEQLGARVFRNPWTNHATQLQWGLDHCGIATAWVMRIDADEYAEINLQRTLDTVLTALPDDVTGLYVRRKYFFLGQWMRRGAMYPIDVLRIWRRGAGRIEQRWMDEHVVLSGGATRVLDADITDDNLNPVGWWIDKHNGYATREMIELLNIRHGFLPKDQQMLMQSNDSQAGRKRRLKENVYAHLPLFVRPLLYFFYRYFLKLGFLDGAKGFAFHFMQGLWYRTLVDLKVLEAEQWIKSCTTPQQIKTVLAEKTGLALGTDAGECR